jgi:hypothetical protein
MVTESILASDLRRGDRFRTSPTGRTWTVKADRTFRSESSGEMATVIECEESFGFALDADTPVERISTYVQELAANRAANLAAA